MYKFTYRIVLRALVGFFCLCVLGMDFFVSSFVVCSSACLSYYTYRLVSCALVSVGLFFCAGRNSFVNVFVLFCALVGFFFCSLN